MHGLVNRSLQCFLQDSHGLSCWQAVAQAAGVAEAGIEALLPCDPAVTNALLDAAAACTGDSRDGLLEDLGIYLVSHPRMAAVRRLLRFGGVGFADFARSLEDLPGRVRLAVPDLVLPAITVAETAPGQFRLRIAPGLAGLGAVLTGVLRAMADDYGTLALIERDDDTKQGVLIRIDLLDTGFAQARAFALAGPSGDPA